MEDKFNKANSAKSCLKGLRIKCLKQVSQCSVWWLMPVIPLLGRLQQENSYEFKAIFGFKSSSPAWLQRENLSQRKVPYMKYTAPIRMLLKSSQFRCLFSYTARSRSKKRTSKMPSFGLSLIPRKHLLAGQNWHHLVRPEISIYRSQFCAVCSSAGSE